MNPPEMPSMKPSINPGEIKLATVAWAPRGPDPFGSAPGDTTGLTEAIRRELDGLGLSDRLEGSRVAVTAGSRGIDRISPVLRIVVDHLREAGADPFLVPAMGSHGGGTPEGRIALLDNLGVTERSAGAPVLSSAETVEYATTPGGLRLCMDRLAFEADLVAVVNRVKAHTRFTGPVQSGLCKMALIGLGGPEGAADMHRATVRAPFEDLVRETMPLCADKTPLAFGLALVENGRKRLAHVRAARAADFLEADADLLRMADEWLPRLPFDEIDLLVVDRIGKDISGTGMDTNVIGRKKGLAAPRVLRIFVRGLTAASRGNATGIGFADAVTRSTADGVDRRATALNCFTALRPSAARVPAIFENDREAIAALLATTGRREARNVRMVRIASTAALERFQVSEALLDEAARVPDLGITVSATGMVFDSKGRLEDF